MPAAVAVQDVDRAHGQRGPSSDLELDQLQSRIRTPDARIQLLQVLDEFTAPDREEAQWLLSKAVDKYQKTASKLATWMGENLPEGFAAFSLPLKLRRRLRSANMVEWVNKEIRRRTRVTGLVPNEQSLLRLVSAILVEISEDWETGKRYVSLDAESLPRTETTDNELRGLRFFLSSSKDVELGLVS